MLIWLAVWIYIISLMHHLLLLLLTSWTRNLLENEIFVFYLGGSTCDVSLNNWRRDFRRAVQKFKSRFNKDISNVRSLCRLKERCECTKRILSASTQAYIGINSLLDGVLFNKFHISWNRSWFNFQIWHVSEKLVESIKEIV